MRRSFFIFLASLLIAAAGVGWGYLQKIRGGENNIVQRRMALLVEENERLRKFVETIQSEKREAEELEIRVGTEQQVARIRGLEFLHPVKYKELSRESLPEVIDQKIDEQYSAEELVDLQNAYIAMGLLPEGFDLRQTYVDLLGEQIAAFYDQHADALYSFENTSLRKGQNRIILAHELTHALQDQHFSLENFPLEHKGNDDLVMATAALIEGDATLLMADYMANATGEISPAQLLLSALGQETEQLRKAPRFLRESLLFPYVQGQKFCMTLYLRGGYRALDAAYALPPKSTAQILHPEKYLAAPGSAPPELEWDGDLEKHGRLLTNNVLGEFAWRSLLGEGLPGGTAAAGWVADRYLVFEKNGEHRIVSWSVWESEADAEAFRKALMTNLSTRHSVTFGKDGSATGKRHIAILRPMPDQVAFYEAGDAETLRELTRIKARISVLKSVEE